MKKFIFLGSLFTISVFSQAQQSTQNITTPNSPAASALGIQPNAVLTPKSADLLELGLYAGLANGSSTSGLPADVAFEFTPYWSKDNELKLEDYLFPEKPFLDQLKRNSSFSLATTQNFALGDSSASSGIGFGYRCTFFFGGEDDRDSIARYRKTTEENLSQAVPIISFARKQIDLMKSDSTISRTKEEFIKRIMPNVKEKLIGPTERFEKSCKDSLPEFDSPDFLNAFRTLVYQELTYESTLDKFGQYLDKRVGFSLDVAYASFLSFPQNNFQQSYLPKQSVWITPSYQGGGKFSNIYFNGVLRYEWYNKGYYETWFPQSTYYTHNFDYGFSISVEAKKFFAQFELVGRTSNNSKEIGTSPGGNPIIEQISGTDLQYIGTFNYQITSTVIISYSIGNRFDPISNPGNTLVSLLTLNLGFGKQSDFLN